MATFHNFEIASPALTSRNRARITGADQSAGTVPRGWGWRLSKFYFILSFKTYNVSKHRKFLVLCFLAKFALNRSFFRFQLRQVGLRSLKLFVEMARHRRFPGMRSGQRWKPPPKAEAQLKSLYLPLLPAHRSLVFIQLLFGCLDFFVDLE